jgi:hypothetical protein
MEEDTYDKSCGLSRFEWQCENIIDEILKEESTLIRIVILKRFVEAHNNPLQSKIDFVLEKLKFIEEEDRDRVSVSTAMWRVKELIDKLEE